MRPIQTTVLNTIQPGRVPVFIVAPGNADGTALAVLMSENIQPVHANIFAEQSNNYFFTPDFTIKDGKTDEQQAYLKLSLSEGLDNNRIWGMQCSYDLFFELNVAAIYPDAFFIFLYGPSAHCSLPTHSDSYFASRITECLKQHTAQCLVLHTGQLAALPGLILSILPIEEGATVAPFTPDVNKKILNDALQPNCEAYNLLNDHNFLHSSNIWFAANDVLPIFVADEKADANVLLRKLSHFACAFPLGQFTTVVCDNSNIATDLRNQISAFSLPVNNINLIDASGNISSAVNKIISNFSGSIVVVDHLLLDYQLTDILLPYKQANPPAAIFSSEIANKLNENSAIKLSLVDILTLRCIPDNMSFPKAIWSVLKGLDEQLDNNVALWELCIRALKVAQQHALEIDAAIASIRPPDAGNEEGIASSAGYVSIIEKHKHLFQENLNQVIRVVSENQFLPQNEIKALNYRVSTLDTMLHHSKDELKSMSELGAELQQRIKQLESKWYYRVAQKINKFKKIFVKKKTPGSRSILKSLKFIVFAFSKPGFEILRKILKNIFKKLYLITEDRRVEIIFLESENKTGINNYNSWINNKLNPDTLDRDYKTMQPILKYQPKISIVVPVYDPNPTFLKEAIESVQDQQYDNWELCLADDCSPNPQIRRLLNAYSLKDKRIKVVFRTENGHISAATNSALEAATGDYILFMDHDDMLTPNCCAELVKFMNECPDKADIIYSDEDKIEDKTFSNPHFKTDWAPDSLMSRNYFGHVVIMKKSIVDSIGGFRLGYEGSQDYDLILRATETTNQIGHVAKVLYHWRIHNKSAAQGEDVKPYAYIAAKKALEDALVRRNTPGEVQFLSGLRGYRVIYDVVKPGKVSIIIPTKDQVELLKNTVDSIIKLTSYPDYEILVLNNNSNTPEFFAMAKEYSERYPQLFRCIDATFPFNFAKLMNIGAAECTGDYLLMLNNDIEVIHDDWMTRMVSYAQQEHHGVVGVKLLYPDDNIQHAGVIIGLGGVAGHTFVNYYKDDAGYFNYIQSTGNYSAVTAACIICRRDVFNEVNGMSEEFQVEYNDVDFCLKVMDKGYYNVYLADVVLYHYESATRGHPHANKVSYERHLKEMKLFTDKWDKYVKRDPYYNANLSLGHHDFVQDFSK